MGELTSGVLWAWRKVWAYLFKSADDWLMTGRYSYVVDVWCGSHQEMVRVRANTENEARFKARRYVASLVSTQEVRKEGDFR
jgi:hypothetical protein